VVLKAQAASLAHKSEVGGVLLGIGGDEALLAAWRQLHANVAGADPTLQLDGVLVEAMGPRGVELAVGASRDPQWGPILMVGLGGVWIEAIGDVQLLPADLPAAAIRERLQALKGAKLLNGFRGTPPVDLDAVVDVVTRIGRLMRTRSDIVEIDVNPLVAYPQGQGAMALDALIVTRTD
jgi:acyl-CoA synthetase (NDP forming)